MKASESGGKSVRIRDVSPRLAFQAQDAPTEKKIELIDRLSASGIQAIEVSSFVSPRLVPGLADADEVFARIRRPTGVSMECCVGNLIGLKRAIDAGANAAWFLLSANEEFSIRNTGRSIESSLAELARMRELAEGSGTRLGTYLIFAWGGPRGMLRMPDEIERIGARLLEIDVHSWILADSCGYAAPPQIEKMIESATSLTTATNVTVQIHDSRGMGVANVAKLIELGIANIDTALCGSGNHPAIPGAHAGGTCTEDVLQLLELMGVRTGIDLESVIETANWFNELLGGREGGFVRRVGKVPLTDLELQRQRNFEFSWRAN
ncbi:hypothetical protein P9281_03040 [Caballeronia sp. LP003]|uniref:hypothetical protein n=1 Tax=Caballeronia sp. LP003 TaxID=3038551 RepID=UPI00286112CA|nr:hypothetical protein [Caballeronia sp. LP003]MDR5785525.1 hypothetical protein [Caballeronia sp. LP003]